MLAQDHTNQYTLLTSGRPTQERPFPVADNVRGRSLLLPDRYVNILWYRWRVPVAANLFTGRTELYHGPDFVLPPLGRRVRKVVTIHDLAFIEHPEYAVPSLATYLQKVVPESIDAADAVIAISQETRRTLIDHFHTPEEKIAIVPLGVGKHFQRITDPILLASTRHKYGLKHPLVLGVGTLEPRKNHLGLIKAFYQANEHKNGPQMLAIAGGQGWLYEETKRLVADLKLERKVRFLGRVSDFDLITLYSMADIFAFPSFFEGFGIPPIEAMACGAPVITSNVSSLPEVVGDAALTVDPHDSEALANAMLRVLENTQLRADLQRKGYERVQHFTWEASARKMLAIYQQLANKQSNVADEG
jgi:glycosyltransferase involved in cell wall biosynthesis